MEFTRQNLPRFAAMFVLVGHCIRNSHQVLEETCLLRHPTAAWVQAKVAALEGCYLFYDSDAGIWIRSGKAAGSDHSVPRAGIVNRMKGHKEAASKSSVIEKNSRLYLEYPTADNPNRLKSARFFEDLVQYNGIAFDRDSNTDGLTSSTEGSNLLHWSKSVLEGLERMNEGGCSTLREKQLVIVSYFFELCYDICLSPTNNISQNPGFESRLHIFH